MPSAPWTASELYAAYLNEHGRYEEVANDYAAEISAGLAAKGLDCEVKARAKDPIDLFKKQRRKQYADPWKECPDLVGARVVVPTTKEMTEVIDSLRASGTFSRFDVEDQRFGADPSEIRYLGLHAHLLMEGVTDSLGNPIRCELQVRTIAQDAWSVTNHRYIYKKDIGLPNQLLRTFNRLLVLTELFDAELQRGVESVSQMQEFRCFELARFLEASLATFGATPGDFESTFETTMDLVNADLGSPEDLRDLVDEYLGSNAHRVNEVLTQFGPLSPAFDVAEYWLTTQGEILVLLALLDSDEYQLASKLQGTDLYDRVLPLAMSLEKTGYYVGID